MIPILFDSNATQFDTNGLGRLIDCISCEVTEERNGVYECEFVYPIDGRNYDKITLERIIAVTHDDTQTLQPFVIYKKSVPINGQVTFNAHHISYRLANVVLEPYTAGSCAEALSLMPAHSINDNPFSFYTDKQTTANFRLAVPMRCKEILGGVEGSILDTFGTGEYEFDGFNVNLWQNRGSVTGVEIRYGKNLSDITDETDASGVFDAVIPFYKPYDGSAVIMLPELAVYADDAPTITEAWTNEADTPITDENGNEFEFCYRKIEPQPLDLSEKFEEPPTEEQLRAAARTYLANNRTWSAARNISVDFVQLWQTDEYARFAALERVKLCDTVRVIYNDADVRIKVIKTVYDVLLDRYSVMELGEPRTTLAETIAEAASTAIVTKVPTKSQMAEFVSEATRKITGGLGGHVVIGQNANGEPNEILIMDTDSVETAVNVIRFNEAGIGFSTSGYNGPFTNAWTIDGRLNADFIRSGKIAGDIIQGGLIQSLDNTEGSSYWNLANGLIATAGPVLTDIYNNQYRALLQFQGGVMKLKFVSPDTTRLYEKLLFSAQEVRDSLNNGDFLPTIQAKRALLIRLDNSNNDYVDRVYRSKGLQVLLNFTGKTLLGYPNKSLSVNAEFHATEIYAGHLYGTLHGDLSAGEVFADRATLGNFALSSSRSLRVAGGSIIQGSTKLDGAVDITGNMTANNITASSITLGESYSAEATRITVRGRILHLGKLDIYPDAGNGSFGDFHIYAFTDQVQFRGRPDGDWETFITFESDGSGWFAGPVLADGYIYSKDYMITDGTVTAAGYNTRSDERLKDFVEWDDRLDEVLDQIEPMAFTWKEGDDRLHLGISAQKTQKTLEDAGLKDMGTVTGDEVLGVNYNDIMMLMLRKIKQQQSKIDSLEARLAALEGRLNGNS